MLSVRDIHQPRFFFKAKAFSPNERFPSSDMNASRVVSSGSPSPPICLVAFFCLDKS